VKTSKSKDGVDYNIVKQDYDQGFLNLYFNYQK